MKILHLIPSLRSGGAERQLIETLKYLTKQDGITCDVVVMSDDIYYDYVQDLDIKIYKVLRKFKKDPFIFYRFYQLFKRLKPDIVHSWNSMCSLYAMPATRMLGITFVNNFLQDAPANLKVTDKEWIRAKLTFPFSEVIAANSYAGLEAYKVPNNKRACLHNGFEFSRIGGIADKETTRDQLGIQTPYVIGMVASFSENKDYTTFVDVAQKILSNRKDITFVTIGDGEYFEHIKNRIKPEFQANFKLPGKQKRVLDIVNIFDIGILTTNTRVHGEGIPNVVMEYMALKKPVIATDCGGNRELIEDNQTGFLINAEEPDQLEEKILLLLENQELFEQFGQNGYEKLKNEFNLEVMGENFLQLYCKLIS